MNTAISRQEILVLTLHDISASPSTSGWYLSSFQSLVDYCITQGIPIITMDDLDRLETENITIPTPMLDQTATLTVNVSGSGTVNQSPAAPYVYGAVVQLTAVPATGWHFVEWTGNLIGSDNPASITMTGNKTVTAVFSQDPVILTVNVSGSGTVTQNPQSPYLYGAVVQLTAVPATGWHFVEWTGDLTGLNNPASITLNGNKTVTAVFAQDAITLTVNVTGSGTVTQNPEPPYQYGASVQLTAIPTTGWHFVEWTGDLTGSVNPASITLNGSKTITAVFAQDSVTLTVNISGSGTVNQVPAAPYLYGSVVQLTAVPVTGWHFVEWTGDLTGSVNPASITLNGSKTITAVFAQSSYTLNVAVAGMGSVTKNPDQSIYSSGTSVQLTVIADTGWTFAGWSGGLSGSTNPVTITMDDNKSITATFTQNTYTLNVTILGTGSVTKNPDQTTYTYGQEVILTSTPADGWTFIGWSGGLSGSTNPVTITMDDNKSITATFSQDQYSLTGSTVGSGSVDLNDTGPYELGDVVQMTALPTAGWHFVEWTGDLTGSDNPASITITGNMIVTAYFAQVEYSLTITQSAGGTIAAAPAGPYHLDDEVTVTATADPGYHFGAWTGDCSGANPCTLTMDGAKSVSATFIQDEYALTITQLAGGTIAAAPAGPYHLNDEVTVTATADPGYHFGAWTGDLTGTTNPTTITLNAAKTVGASFTQNSVVTLPKDLIVTPCTLREDYDTMTGWTVSGSGTGYSAVLDTANYKVGGASIKLTTPSATGNVAITKYVNWDLLAPAEQGNFRFWVYVHGSGEPTDFQILMSNDTTFQNYFTTYYNTSYKFRYRPGWNLINLRTSDWRVAAGSPSWTNPYRACPLPLLRVYSGFILTGWAL